ncbi:MAG: carboxypeptidase regulatory-like domain-containing protein [Pyrinomonadaceae bacterium]|nr:carboxypeptidase regulatory-like domain-containing protein [Pyrinomonadaceae bacterium]
MSRRWLFSLLGLSLAVFFVQLVTATSGLRVNEAATRFLIEDQVIVILEVVNPLSQELSVHLRLELLDPDDAAQGSGVRNFALRPGLNKLTVPLALSARSLTKDGDTALPWYRLRYRIDPSRETKTNLDAVSGVISLSEIDTPNIFALEVTAPAQTQAGTRHYTHVRAFNPITRKPVKGVEIGVEFQVDEDAPAAKITNRGITDDSGYALVSIDVPASTRPGDGDLKVVARHGGYIREMSDEIEVCNSTRIMVTTDKPIYQPGQALHIRALVFNSANRAAANAEATLKINDPENTNVFEASLVTSRFGVANADWVIPENTRLGDYSIRVEMDEENYGDSEGLQIVKISRYDLPTFAVNVKPDRTYYLPQHNADVEVRADYLFGQPVKRGHVRVVLEDEREWNFREQKWDIDEGEEYEGETDDAGRFVARVDLRQAHKELAEEEYSRFKDLKFAAYFTDPTSNRTEQRRFDLRLTKEAIHIYVTEGNNRQARDFPMQYYLATSYADGTPARCEVAISESARGDDKPGSPTPVLQTILTNKYGLAKVTGLKLPATSGERNLSLAFTARNGAGSLGHHVESFYDRDVPVIRVETDKVLYRRGDPIRVSVTASKPEMNMVVDVARESHIIESRTLSLHDGAATFTLAYRPEFQDELSISVYSRTSEYSDYYHPFGSRTVLFPRNRDLNVELRLDHPAYKPGESATVDFRVFAPDGRPADSALGIVIFDQAVEERARTEREFGGRFGFSGSFSEWQGYDNQIGGITRKDLQRLDPAKPLPDDMELVAELLLGARQVERAVFSHEGFETDHTRVFANLTGLHIKPIADLLQTQYTDAGTYPSNRESLLRLLFESGIDFDQLRDPWGTPYRELFSVVQDDSVLEIISAGPDKVFTTGDDSSVARITRSYFRFTGEAISRAVKRFHARTGGFIRNATTLKNELRAEGIDFDSLRDPWGQPYQLNFTTRLHLFNVTVRSAGPDKSFADAHTTSDDVTVWLASVNYLVETRARMEKAIDEYFEQMHSFPRNDSELQQAFATSGIEAATLRDPWGHRFYASYKTEMRLADRTVIQSFATYGQLPKERMETTPVTHHVGFISLRSSGEDGKEGTADDFDVATFSRLTAELSRSGVPANQPSQRIFFPGSKGAIKGVVTDPNGAVVPGIAVTASLKNSSQNFETKTDDEGRFILRNLPVGFYEVRCEAPGFTKVTVLEVPVSSSNVTTVNFTLYPGTVSETVTVSAAADVMNMTSSSVATTITEGRLRVSIAHPMQLTTPRLREYFPETLVWQPSLETDKHGRAQLKFKLADNITTWKMSVIGSTEDGELGVAETEIKAFQPFFVEHDPPRVLTEGDQISLPIVLRNYLERGQAVDLEIKPESWFALLGPARQRADVPAGEASRQTFELKAVASVKDGKQRITARGSEASDAIEKPVTVHPDGEEKTQTASQVFGDTAMLNINLPASAIPGSTQAELKIYPGLMSHVIESIEGILKRPYGCGEQTISSTYPSLLVLRGNKQSETGSPIRAQAQRYARAGYQRLLNYRSTNGGFSYWGHGEPDLALSAYALRFLHDAAEFVSVDPEVVKGLRQWLVKQQHADGSWPASAYNSGQVDKLRGIALQTAFVARVLAMTEPQASTGGATAARTASPELKRALSYLSPKIEAIDEPHLIASYALAAIDAGDRPGASRAVARLRALARNEGDTTYWKLETATPFNGWGLAGEVETTALATQALARFAKTQPDLTTTRGQSADPVVSRGLLHLLRQKDRYGVWYSTQATINVLDTLTTLLATDISPDRQSAAQGTPVEVIVNGLLATSLQLPTREQNTGLVRADISRFLQPGANHVELRRSAGSGLASAQLVANYYVPWSAVASGDPAVNGAASSLRLSATFDKKAAGINDEIVCSVKAERVDYSRYGMMLAEIGLPPGADVDRASLESAMKASGGALSHYDVLPDRVVVYLWPRSGGVQFAFKFRPRLAMTAKTAPSLMYDYYNPDARVVVEPATFVVR